MGKTVLLAERSGNWLYFSDTATFARATPEPSAETRGVELWLAWEDSTVESQLAAVRFPTGWSPGLCWTWAIRNLDGSRGENLLALPPGNGSDRDRSHLGYEWLKLGGEGSALIAHCGSVSELMVLRWSRAREEGWDGKGKRPGTHGQAA